MGNVNQGESYLRAGRDELKTKGDVFGKVICQVSEWKEK